MRNFIEKNLYIVFFFLTILYVILSFNKSNIQNHMFWDFPGHLYQSISLFTNVDSAIYSFQYFMGFYPALYPPLTSYIRDIALNFMPVKSYVLLFYIFNYYIFWVLTNKLFQNKGFNLFFILTFIYFIFAPEYSLITVQNINSGSMPGLMGYNLILIYLYVLIYSRRDNYYSAVKLGLIGGLIILTHAISASVYLLIAFVTLFIDVYQNKKQQIEFLQLKSTFFAILVSLLIGIPWIYFLIMSGLQVPKLGVSGVISVETIIILGLLLFLLAIIHALNIYKYKNSDLILLIVTTVLLLLGTTSKFLSINSNSGLHFYRYYPYAIYFLLIFLGRLYNNFKLSSPKIFIIGLVMLFYISFSLVGYSDFNLLVKIDPLENKYVQSQRILDITLELSKVNAPYYISTEISRNSNLLTTYGLFAQDSPLFIFISSIKYVFSPNVTLNLVSTDLKENDLFKKIGDINEKLDLFGVSYLVTEETTIEKNKDILVESGLLNEIGSYKIKDESGKFYLYDTNFEYGVVEPLSYLPPYTPEASIVDRWEKLNKNNLYSKDISVKDIKYNKSEIKPQIIKNLKVTSDKLSFKVDSDFDIPILIKFADSPVLKVENNGKLVEKYNVSPGFFFVYGKGQFDIYPQAPKMLHLLVNLSKLLILLMSIYLIYIRLFMNRKVTG